MNCSDAEVLIHAMIDGELDAGHAREVDAHVASCAECAGKLAALRTMHQMMTEANLKETAPLYLRSRIEAALPAPSPASPALPWRLNRRFFAGGFAMGAALSAAIAAAVVISVFRGDEDQLIASEVVSAHLRSLQPGHLTDVETSDQHTVKPWFNGKLDVAPPVIDLTAQDFTLIGGRLDDINGSNVAAIVYRRRNHVVNLFVAQRLGAEHSGMASMAVHGFALRHWTENGLDLWAISDINADELDQFCRRLSAALKPAPQPS
jgi:anti-sigma factor RsiW